MEAFRNLQNLFWGFCRAPYFFSEYVIKIAGITADKTFNTTDELIAKHKHHNIRLHCLLNPWSSMPNLTNNNNDHVESYDRKITNFIHDVGDSLKKARSLKLIDPYIVLDEYDNKMNQTFSKIKKNIHSALCNDILIYLVLWNKQLIYLVS
jgi:cysteinyl-tRNA synthetase